MGKASRELNEAYKAIYETQEELHTEQDEQYNNVLFHKENENRNHMLETAIILRNNLIMYTEQGSYSLCEHLDINNVYNFVQYILKER